MVDRSSTGAEILLRIVPDAKACLVVLLRSRTGEDISMSFLLALRVVNARTRDILADDLLVGSGWQRRRAAYMLVAFSAAIYDGSAGDTQMVAQKVMQCEFNRWCAAACVRVMLAVSERYAWEIR